MNGRGDQDVGRPQPVEVWGLSAWSAIGAARRFTGLKICFGPRGKQEGKAFMSEAFARSLAAPADTYGTSGPRQTRDGRQQHVAGERRNVRDAAPDSTDVSGCVT